jgi:heme oxygenase
MPSAKHYLFNLHLTYDVLETLAMSVGLLDAIPELCRASRIYQDYQELWQANDRQPVSLKCVWNYTDYLQSIQHDRDGLMAHIYVRHMGDLSGGQLIASRVPGKGLMYQFDRPIPELKAYIRDQLHDGMADEAKLCFKYSTRLFQEMSELSR